METMTDHNCVTSRAERFATEESPFHFVDSGLPNVYLIGIKYFTCECGRVVAEIPATKQLMKLIARDLVKSSQSLTGSEIRFLRKRLGKRATEFSKELGIESETLSRLENGKQPLKEPMDKLIRLVYAVSSEDLELLRGVMNTVNSWLVAWSERTGEQKIVKRIDDNEWSNALAA
jgi:putative zinc finger/helix-turn-helix YgiT family protein